MRSGNQQRGSWWLARGLGVFFLTGAGTVAVWGLSGCGTNIGGADVCAARRQYSVLCGTSYIDSTCQHDAACEFLLYKEELILTQHQCVLNNVTAQTCQSSQCAGLQTVEQVIAETEQLGPAATAFVTSCIDKAAACNGIPYPSITGFPSIPPLPASQLCNASPIYQDSVFANMDLCASVSCQNYLACIETVLEQNVGPGCTSVTFLGSP